MTTTMETKEIVEGSATMIYPANQEQTVFYNPVQVQNRDLSVLMIALYAERRRVRQQVKEYRKQLVRDSKQHKFSNETLKERLDSYRASLDGTKIIQDEDSARDGLTILDALAASGLRSIRYWKEIPGVKHVSINDLDPAAIERARANVSVNHLTNVLTQDDRGHGIRIVCGDATHEMYLSRKPPGQPSATATETTDTSTTTSHEHFHQKDQWDVIDLDPYGSAAPFLDAAVQAVRDGGMLCITCTDMAALGGSHPETAYGRYGSIPIQRAKYLQEFALRILLHTLAVSAARYGRTIKPILSVGMAFYVRVFVEVYNDKAGVQDLSLNIGSVYQSTQCPSFHTVPHGQHKRNNKNVYQAARAPKFPSCPETGAPFKVGGPIWLGPLHDYDVVDAAIQRLETEVTSDGTSSTSSSDTVVPNMKWIATKKRLHGLLTIVSEELPDVPLYYTLPDLCRQLCCTCPPTIKMKAALVNAGYRVSAYHKEPQAIKTDAPNHVVWDVLRAWCKKNPPASKRKKRSNANSQDDETRKKILAVEPSITIDFTVPKGLNQKKRRNDFP